MYQNNPRCRILRLVMARTNGYQPQYIRPYAMTTETYKRNEILNRLDPNRPISPTTLGGEVSGLIKPSINIDDTLMLDLPAGWGSERLRWIMTIEIQHMGATIIQYLTGYTDHVGVSLQTQSIDPNLRFFINNSFQFRVDSELQNGVPIRRLVPTRLNQVLTNLNYSRNQLMNSALVRPQDVLNFVGTASIRDQIYSQNIAYETATLTNRATLGNISNINPTAFTARILDAQRRAFVDGNQYGQSNDSIIERAIDFVREDSQRNDPFLNVLLSSSSESLIGNDFTWSTLNNIDPNVNNEQITQLIMKDSASPTMAMNASNMGLAYLDSTNSSRWDECNYLQQAATIIRDSTNSLMAETMFNSIAFSVTNESGQFTYSYSGGTLFVPDVDPSPFFYRFIERLINEAVMDISFNNNTRLELHVISEFVGDTKIQLKVGDQYGEFVAPTFCSSLTAPVIAGSQGTAQLLADNIGNIVNEVYDNFSNKISHAVTNISDNPSYPSAVMDNFPL
ncbi:MAG: hypothetical protein M0R77_00925 [Gammaproteobacteria bacterium]|nr:hypothetical protein [Acholeplasmataceae bacterium]MCK9529118.1 hypothetical protein [Gammaproteobacteria bacterium]